MSGKLDLDAERKRTAFFDAEEWAWSLIADPRLEAICPWEDIAEDWDEYDAGDFWYEVLMAHPEMIRHAPDPFPGEYLDATRWAKVLLLHPELESKVPWDDLKRSWDKEARLAWMRLLVSRPRFAKYCHWEMFFSRPEQNNLNEWIKLLQYRPQFIRQYLQMEQEMDPDDRRELISTWDWVRIVAVRPELLCYAPVRKFGKDEWKCINEKQPQLSRKTAAKTVAGPKTPKKGRKSITD